MEACARYMVPFGFILLGCSSSPSTSVDAGPIPEGGSGACTISPGTPKAQTFVDGYFDNGVFSGFVRTWQKNTTPASSISLGCSEGTLCKQGSDVCAHVLLEGSPNPFSMPSYLEPDPPAPQVGFGLDVNQGPDRARPPVAWLPDGDGLYVSFTTSAIQWYIVQITAEGPTDIAIFKRWCSSPGSSTARDVFIPWETFRLCDGSSGVNYSPTQPIVAIDFFAEPAGQKSTEFDLCLRDLVPFGLSSEILSCADWYRYPIPGTRNVLINNVWNAQRAGSASHTQCLRRRCTQQGEQFGWTWAWPEVVIDTSYAAPEVLFGRKPWDGGASTTPDLPRRIDAIQSLPLDYDIQIMARQSYNLNATFWITRTPEAPDAPDPENIVAEVMIRFSNPVGIGGGTVDDGQVTLDGIPFKVTHQAAHADASGGSPYTWTMVVYESLSPNVAGQIDLALVLRDLVAKGLVKPEHGVQGVELITEISGDVGEVWLNRFDVSVH